MATGTKLPDRQIGRIANFVAYKRILRACFIFTSSQSSQGLPDGRFGIYFSSRIFTNFTGYS